MKTWTIIVLLIFTHILFLSGCTNSEEVKKAKTKTAIEKIDSTAETNTPEIVILVEEQMNYSEVGEVLADDIINPTVENVDATSLSSISSVATIYDIVDGLADLAVIRNDLAYFASHGYYLFEGDVPVTGFHGVATLYPEVIHIIARPESGIQTVDDLVGKRVAVGKRGSVFEVNAKQM